MKKILIEIVIVLGAVVALSGCYYDEIAEFAGLPTGVSFKNDVSPILTKNCTTTGCHDATPAHEPSLVSDKAYEHLTSGGFINTIEPDKSQLYLILQSNQMPPSGPLGTNDLKIILGWITDGAPNN